ncbi:cyclase family protein [Gottschalkiaceae bacterium SANA]|nr:cyclase family protein [Gottschalkiaceae bacterium SANA]
MKMFIDCSHLIEEGMPVYPGTEGPTLLQACTIEEVGFREKKWTMYSHMGTHMDAPAHMIADGKTLDQFSVEKFMGRGMILDVRECTAKEIPLGRLQAYESILKKVDYVLIQTGWELFWGSEQYVGSFPALSIEAAEYMMQFNLKGIGVDAISIDLMDTESFPIHKILLENDLVIIENLKNMSLLEGQFDFYAFPLNVEDADGSPIRAIAVVEE